MQFLGWKWVKTLRYHFQILHTLFYYRYLQASKFALQNSEKKFCGTNGLNTSWNISYLENSLRTFIFKLHNNILTYNHVVAHFAENIEPYCTFCLITRNNDPERDTVLHVFYSCPITEQFNERFFSWIFGVNRIVGRSEVFGIFKEENVDNNKILFIITKISQKYIWDCKLRKTLPALDDLKNIVKSEVQILRKISITFNDCLQSCSLLTLK